jgi:hypothetical protein
LSPFYISRNEVKTIRWCGKQPKESTTFPLTNDSSKVNITCLFTYVYVHLEEGWISGVLNTFKGSAHQKAAGIPGVESAKYFGIIIDG